MGDRLFNLYDVFLIIAVFEALALAVFRTVLASHFRSGNTGGYFLAAFLIVTSIDLVTGLLMWNEAIVLTDTARQTGLALAFTLSHFARGPLFYFYVRTLLFKRASTNTSYVLHALPSLFAVLGVALMGVTTADLQSRSGNITTTQVASIVWYLSNGLSIFYALWCLVLLRRYLRKVKEQHSTVFTVEVIWLTVLSVCFLISWSWSILINLSADLIGGHFADAMGTSHNLIRFVLMNALVYCSLVCTNRLVNISLDKGSRAGSHVAREEVNPKEKNTQSRIESGISEQQLHLQPGITLDEFSERIGVSAKEVSAVLNGRLNTRFFEYINQHRIEEAKRLLSDPSENHLSITDIFTRAGFNNKSSFHRFFGRLVKVSPSEYRQSSQKG